MAAVFAPTHEADSGRLRSRQSREKKRWLGQVRSAMVGFSLLSLLCRGFYCQVCPCRSSQEKIQSARSQGLTIAAMNGPNQTVRDFS